MSRISIKIAKYYLLLISLLFYSQWSYYFLCLLIGSIIINYSASILIIKKKSRNLLALIIIINLIYLSYYKYFAGLIDINLSIEDNFIPIGISFYTFTQLSYLIDTYKQKSDKISFLNYCIYITWFPHLISGPLLHYKQISPQLNAINIINIKNINLGILFFTIGLFKKVILADNLAQISDPIFNTLPIEEINPLNAWIAVISFSFQLYFDFSGYSDMAIGISLLFNIELPINFNSPYKADSIIEFWKRWHISLSNYLKNYLYIPLGGNKTKNRWFLNIFITMIIGGIWHGSTINFLIWGVLHAIYICINHIWRRLNFKTPKIISWAITMFFVVIAWLPFRANSIDQLIFMLNEMFSFSKIILPLYLKSIIPLEDYFKYGQVNIGYAFSMYEVIILLFICFCVVIFLPNSHQLLKKYSYIINNEFDNYKIINFFTGILTSLTLFIIIINLNKYSPFLYFQF